MDATRYLVLRRISVRKSIAAVGYKYYMTRHHRIRWNLVECDVMSKVEHEAVRENCLEEISLSVGITKVMNIVTIKDGIPPHSGREK